MKGILEILRTRVWMISPEFAHAAKSMIQSNLNSHTPFDPVEKRCGQMYMPISGETADYDKDKKCVVVGGDKYSVRHMTDPFVDVLYVTGPITRGGDDCTYGSSDLRDQMMMASDNLNCVGHIFYIDTPGGSAWAINDFKQGIDYAKSKKQPCCAFIDGMCDSAGMYLASQCEERYFMHPKDEVGCIGVMAAFYTEKDGSHNAYTNEDYHEVYDPESFDKNKWCRDITNDDNSDMLVEDLKKLGSQFRKDVKKGCPKCTDDQLHGKTFDAGDVVGTLMDGQSDFGGVCNRMVELSASRGNAAAKQVQKDAQAKNEHKDNNIKSTKNMTKEQSKKLAQQLEVEELQVTELGTFMNTPLLDKVSEKLTAAEATAEENASIKAELDTAKAAQTSAEVKLAEKDAKIAELQGKLDAATKAQVDASVASEKASAEAKAAADKAMADKQAELDAAKKLLVENEGKMKEKEGMIADLNEQIKALQSNPGEDVKAGAQPSNNGSNGLASEPAVPAWDDNDPVKSVNNLRQYQANLNKINANRG